MAEGEPEQTTLAEMLCMPGSQRSLPVTRDPPGRRASMFRSMMVSEENLTSETMEAIGMFLICRLLS